MKKSVEKIKVCHITTIDMSLRFLLFNQLIAIKDEGYDIYAVSSEGPWVEQIKEAGINFYPVLMKRKISPLSDIAAVFKMARFFRKEKIDIIHTHTPKGGLLGQLAGVVSCVPVRIHTIHGFYFHDNMSYFERKFYIAFEKVVSLCSHFLFSQNSEDILTAGKEGICTDANRIEYLGNGINLEIFSPEKVNVNKKEFLRELGIPEDAFIVGSVGRLSYEKGYKELITAMKGVVGRYPNSHLIIIGPDDVITSSELIEFGKSMGIEKNIHLPGLKADMPQFYRLMDIFVLPSYREGFPRALMEAAAMGLPLIATDIRGCREVVKHNENGLLVPVKDSDAVEEAIIKYMESPDLACKLGINARKYALENFDEKKVHQKVLRKYGRFTNELGQTAV